MRHSITAFFSTSVAALILCASQAHGVRDGDTREQVISELGKPLGAMKSGNKEILTYDEGIVTLAEGKVVSSTVRSSGEPLPDREPAQAQPQKVPPPAKQDATKRAQALWMDPTARNKSAFRLPLADVPPMPMDKVDIKKFLDSFTAFQHAPFDESGFSHVTLPFHYESKDGNGGPEEAHAFSFLLSNALDWTPGCYCARHAYFVYKRTGADIIRAGRTFDSNLIGKICGRWTATHAVGGKLTRNKKGYSAVVKIFDSDGNLVHEADFSKPQDYFDLLGAVTGDVMRYFKYEPPPALVKHLSAKRCKDFQSIADLGRAAFADERSPAEFALYAGILERDPDFAEVRYWYYNQKAWHDDSWREYRRQLGVSLKSYVTEAALVDFDSRYCEDREVAIESGSWTMQAVEFLGGFEHPTVLHLLLRSGDRNIKTWRNAVKTAARYPNDYRLIGSMLDLLIDEHEGIMDCDYAASMAWASLNSNYKWGSPDAGVRRMYGVIGEAMMNLGNYDVAANLHNACFMIACKRNEQDSANYHASKIAEALRRAGHYEDCFNVSVGVTDPNRIHDSMRNSMVATAVCGQKKVFDALFEKQKQPITAAPFLNHVHGLYSKALDHSGILKHGESFSQRLTRNDARELVLLQAQADCIFRTNLCKNAFLDQMEVRPMDREFWVIFDAYDRLASRPESAYFYQAIEWLSPRDPWVLRAVADFRKRPPQTAVIDPVPLMTALKDYEPSRWTRIDVVHQGHHKQNERLRQLLPPGAVAAAVQQLASKGENDKAKEFALRYAHYASHHEYPDELLAFCYHLYHLADKWKPGGSVPLTKSNGRIGASDDQDMSARGGKVL